VSTPEGPGYAANFMRRLIEEGASAAEGLRRYRAAGGAIRTQVWYRSFGETARVLAEKGKVLAAPRTRRPAADEVTTWTTRRATGYIYQAEVQVRLRGTSEIFTTNFSFKSDRLVRYGAALDSILDAATSDIEQYGEIVLGGYMTGVYELQPEQ
jgi:hypothetical protein